MFPAYLKPVSIFLRKRRNRRLNVIIENLWLTKGGPVNVLDIGGSLIFWLSIPASTRAKCKINLINLAEAYEDLPPAEESLRETATLLIGDARDLSRFADGAFDLVICNSVIEHVGSWLDMRAAANEARRVGLRGWIQVPAFEFPVEQHFLLPFIHWFADTLQIRLLGLLHRQFRKLTPDEQHMSVFHTRPLTRGQLSSLFPEAEIRSEWLLFPKSHVASW